MADLSFNWEALRDHKLEHFVADQVVHSISEHDGDILVFLPGEAEIMYTWVLLNNMGYGDGKEPANLAWQARQFMEEGRADPNHCVQVVPLYGSMGRDDQEGALRHREGWRKVLLATPIAESSLTLPSIKVVIDTGLRRTVFTDPKTGVTFMKTVPVSAASADQRKGRAGRVSAGACYRVWNEHEQKGLQEQDQPELHLGDVCSAVLDLSLAGCCSEATIAELPWVDPPKANQLKDACALLARMSAIEFVEGDDGRMLDEWRLTYRGRELSRFPLHPRLAHMIFQARQVSKACAIDACHLAALLEDKDILNGGRKKYGADVQIRLDAFKEALASASVLDTSNESSKVMKDVNMFVQRRASRTSQQLQRVARIEDIEDGPCSWESDGCPTGVLIAWACPELVGTKVSAMTKKQIADARWGFTSYRMFSGNEGRIKDDSLRRCEHIAVARAQDNKIFLAAEINPELLSEYGIDFANPTQHDVMGCIA
jgi:ATP-dependent helicase HrpB